MRQFNFLVLSLLLTLFAFKLQRHWRRES